MQYLRLLLLPFSVLYGIVVWLRNKLYDLQIFTSREYSLPVVCIGNLAVGGAGKSPMAEYIIHLTKDSHKVAVLSRGYKRETKGFRVVQSGDTAALVGDEPLQFKKKFGNVTVAVAEKRVEGIERLKESHNLIVLDDAFQHRAVKAGLNILLFDYTRINEFFIPLPAGNLREFFLGRKRADVIVITKCPESLPANLRYRLEKKVKPFKHQQLFFSYLNYDKLIPMNEGEEKLLSSIEPDTHIFLLTGIANPYPLVEKLSTFTTNIQHHDYPDHHTFSQKNITKLANEFRASSFSKTLIITTEKDWQRLQQPALLELLHGLPVYYLPVRARIHQPDEDRFNELIKSYASEYLHHN